MYPCDNCGLNTKSADGFVYTGNKYLYFLIIMLMIYLLTYICTIVHKPSIRTCIKRLFCDKENVVF